MKYTLDLIRGLEEELLKPSVRASSATVRNLLANDFIEFGRSGQVYTKYEVVRDLAIEGIGEKESLSAEDFRLRHLADGAVLLTYRSFRIINGKERRHTLRSSIWQFIDERWQMVFHQGTPTDR